MSKDPFSFELSSFQTCVNISDSHPAIHWVIFADENISFISLLPTVACSFRCCLYFSSLNIFPLEHFWSFQNSPATRGARKVAVFKEQPASLEVFFPFEPFSSALILSGPEFGDLFQPSKHHSQLTAERLEMAVLERPERPWGLVLQHLKDKGKTLLGCSVEREFGNTLKYTKHCSKCSRGAANSPGFSLTHPASCSDLSFIIPPGTCPHLILSLATELEFK